jgi:tetratricopeptide (TPR) repeat protein
MAPFWTSRGDWTEGVDRLRAALALTGGDARLRTRAMIVTGNLLLLRGDLRDAEDRFAEAGERAMAAGDDATTARALAGAGYVYFRNSRLADAQETWEEALAAAEQADDERVATSIIRSLAIASASRGDQIRAGELLDRAIESAQRMQDDQLLRQLLGSSAERHLWLGRYDVAAKEYGEALDLATAIGDLSARPLLLTELGWVALLRGDVTTAERLSVEAVELAEDVGNRRVLAQTLRLRGEALIRHGAATEAASSLEQAQTVAEELGAPAEVAGVRSSQACLALEELQLDDARRLAEEAIGAHAMLHPMRRTSPGWVLGVAAMVGDDLHAAERYFQAEIEAATNPRAPVPRHEANSVYGLAVVNAAAGSVIQAAELHLRALELRRRIGDRLGVADSLVSLAAVALGTYPDDAARLVGAATALRLKAGATPTKRETAELSAVITVMERAEEPAWLSGARNASGHMDEDAAIAIAMRLGARVQGTQRR